MYMTNPHEMIFFTYILFLLCLDFFFLTMSDQPEVKKFPTMCYDC